MKKAFLSHNNYDKDFVKDVASNLGYLQAIIDSNHFHQGHDFRELILQHLKSSDIFVLFASKHALSAPWVKYEMNLAEMAILNQDLSQILVLMIDSDITHKDLPEWLQNSLIKHVESPMMASEIIKSFLNRNDNKLYLGRWKEEEEFSRHYFRADKQVHNLVFFGLTGVGRRTFAEKIISQHFNMTLSKQYDFDQFQPLKSLYRNLLIDFKVISDITAFDNILDLFGKSSTENQIKAIVHYLEKFSSHNQVPVIYDRNGMLDNEGNYVEEISLLMQEINKTEKLYVVYIQNRNPRTPFLIPSYFVSFVPELSLESTEQLLKRYCERFLDLRISKDDANSLSQYIKGYPPVVEIAANEIKIYGLDVVKAKPNNLIKYSETNFIAYIRAIVTSEDEYLIKILSNFGSLSLSVLDILTKNTLTSIHKLIDHSILVQDREAKIYSISGPLMHAINMEYGILNRHDYNQIATTLLERYDKESVPDINALNTLITSLLRADMNQELIKFKSLILPTDLYKNAIQSYRQKNWRIAKDLFLKVIMLNEEHVDSIEHLVKCKIRLKENSNDELRKLKTLSVERYYLVLAFKNMKEGKFSEAIKLYSEIIQKGNPPIIAYRDLAECYYQMSNYLKVDEILRLGLSKTNYKNKFMLDLGAKNAIKQNNFEIAQEYITLLESTDSIGSVSHRKAALSYKKGELDNAKKFALEAIQQTDARSEFYLLLTNIYLSLNEISDAKQTLTNIREKFQQLNIEKNMGYVKTLCLFHIKNNNLIAAKTILDSLKNNNSEYLELLYLNAYVSNPDLDIILRINAKDRITFLSTKKHNEDIIDL